MDYVPKMLPHLARAHGLSDLRAEQIWWEASKYARNATGEFDTPKYWKASYDRLIDLVKAEAFINDTRASAVAGLGKNLLLVTDLLAEISSNARGLLTRVTHQTH
jgi:hypothetical protein